MPHNDLTARELPHNELTVDELPHNDLTARELPHNDLTACELPHNELTVEAGIVLWHLGRAAALGVPRSGQSALGLDAHTDIL